MSEKRQTEVRDALDRLARRIIDAQTWEVYRELWDTYWAAEHYLKLRGLRHLLTDSRARLFANCGDTLMRLLDLTPADLQAEPGDNQ